MLSSSADATPTFSYLPSKHSKEKNLLAQLEKKKEEESFSFMHLGGNTAAQELLEHKNTTQVIQLPGGSQGCPGL